MARIWPILMLVLAGCSATDRTTRLVEAYHLAMPPNELFAEVDEARYLGAVGGLSLLYYDFAWGVNPDSLRGTQKVLVFDSQDRYLGSYYLGGALDLSSTRLEGNCLTLAWKGSDEVETLDFKSGPPGKSDEQGLSFHAISDE